MRERTAATHTNPRDERSGGETKKIQEIFPRGACPTLGTVEDGHGRCPAQEQTAPGSQGNGELDEDAPLNIDHGVSKCVSSPRIRGRFLRSHLLVQQVSHIFRCCGCWASRVYRAALL